MVRIAFDPVIRVKGDTLKSDISAKDQMWQADRV